MEDKRNKNQSELKEIEKNNTKTLPIITNKKGGCSSNSLPSSISLCSSSETGISSTSLSSKKSVSSKSKIKIVLF
jgi:hypothetical protein